MDPKQHVENLNFAFSWLIELILKIFVVDVDFSQNLVVDCRPNSKKVVESTKRWTPLAPPLNSFKAKNKISITLIILQ